jgi:hypothetical protein
MRSVVRRFARQRHGKDAVRALTDAIAHTLPSLPSRPQDISQEEEEEESSDGDDSDEDGDESDDDEELSEEAYQAMLKQVGQVGRSKYSIAADVMTEAYPEGEFNLDGAAGANIGDTAPPAPPLDAITPR